MSDVAKQQVVPEVTPEMIEAGKLVLYGDYAGVFDARENDPALLLEMIFQAMSEARR